MPKAVIVDHKKCTGCRICEIACSMNNKGTVSYERSRIRVYTVPPSMDIPIVCAQCQQAPCIEPLPSGIAKGHPLTQARLNHMLDEYCRLRGWDESTGIPTKDKLRELKLQFITN